MDSSAHDLDWDDQEAVTIPSRRRTDLQPPAEAQRAEDWARKSSRKGWLVITNSEHQRDPERAPADPVSSPIPLVATFQQVRAALPVAVDTTQQRTHDLAQEVKQLRRWLLVCFGLSVIATICAAVAVAVAVAPQSISRHVPVQLPHLPQGAQALAVAAAAPVAPAPEAAPAPATAKVKLTIALFTHATVNLTPAGGTPELLQGPWPRTLDLDAGHYTLTASHGSRVFMRQLDLDPAQPERQITIQLD